MTTHTKYRLMLLTALLLVLHFSVSAQNNSDKLYGFSQAVLPGAAAAKRVTDDAGNVVERRTEDIRFNYFIYVTTAAPTRVYPIEVWIKGEAFSARPEAVAKTPVEHTDNIMPGRPQKTTLVPKTTQKVTRLIPTPLVADKSTSRGQMLAQENELVVVYRQGGKTIYKTLKTLNELTPQALQ